jgi:TolB-like protein/tRNA A-37 threonylcarbamoyl transferase component Bud32
MSHPIASSLGQVPTKIGRYVDVTLLGHGGMGAIYRARDPELDRQVAIKVMLQTTSDFVARFRREAQTIARLVHPNVVQVFDFGVDEEENPYFVMELVEGTALDELLRRHGRFDVSTAIGFIRQAALGLGAAHRVGIIHRDIKPSNLIVDLQGTLKLVDFGIARLSSGGAQLTAAASLMGTPGYMAPEQASGGQVDGRADLYALGLTLYELLAGEPPFVADDPIALVVKNLNEPLPDLRQKGLGLPEELIQVIERLGQKDPAERPQNCEALVQILDQLDPVKSVTMPTPPIVKPRRTSFIVGAMAAFVVLIGAGVMVRKKLHATELPPVQAAEAVPISKPAAVSERSKGPLRVAVFRFHNIGTDPALALLERGIGETALSTIGGSNVQLIERADLESDLGEIDRGADQHFDRSTVAQKGKLEGVEFAVQGGFQRAGNQLRVTARFVRVENGEIVDTLIVTRAASDLFAAQDEVANGLKQKLVSLAAKERKP